MSGIHVSIGPLAKTGRLYPNYDAESDILTVTSEMPREWPYGIDIDGNVVFDLDTDRILANVDIHIGRRLWHTQATHPWPKTVAGGTLVFSVETIKQKSFNLALWLQYDENQGILSIEIGTGRADKMLSLSNECIALLSSDQLVGFLVRGL